LIGVGGAAALAYVIYWALNGLGDPFDVRAYYDVNLADPYLQQDLNGGAFLYTPPFALFGAVLHLLPFELVVTAWRLGQSASLLLLAGPFAAFAVFTYPVASELNLGNVNLYIALAAVVGLRWPAVWSFVLITKPSCGVGLLWFVARRDWRALRTALVVTAGFVVASLILIPSAWIGYFTLLMNPAPTLDGMPVLWLRLPMAAVVVVVGSVRNWRPAIVIAAWLGLPVWHPVSPAVLVGVAAFMWQGPLVDRAGWAGGLPSRWRLPKRLQFLPTAVGLASSPAEGASRLSQGSERPDLTDPR
jgi:hypothetical protein